MGCNPQLPHLLVYHRLKHLGLHGTRKPLEASLNAVTFQHSSWLRGERGDGPGWEPGRSLVGGAICLGNCRISVSKQCASCCDLQLGSMDAGRWFYRATPVTAPGYWARMLGNQEQELARQQGRRGGV